MDGRTDSFTMAMQCIADCGPQNWPKIWPANEAQFAVLQEWSAQRRDTGPAVARSFALDPNALAQVRWQNRRIQMAPAARAKTWTRRNKNDMRLLYE